MTPFAVLGQLEKSAYQAQQNPYAQAAWQAVAPRNQPAAQGPDPLAPGPRFGEASNGWVDAGLSMLPGVGTVYMGNKAVNNFKNGEWMQGIGNGLMAGLSIIPGVGAVKGLYSGAKAGLAAARGAGAAARGATGGLRGAASAVGSGVNTAAKTGWGAARGGASGWWNATKSQGWKAPAAGVGAVIGGNMLGVGHEYEPPAEQYKPSQQGFLNQGTQALKGMDFGQ